MFFACEADASSVSPSAPTNYIYTPYLTGEKHTISKLVMNSTDSSNANFLGERTIKPCPISVGKMLCL